MPIYGPNYTAGINDMCTDNYTFSNSGLGGTFGTKFTVMVVVGGYGADHSDNTCLNAAIADTYDDTLNQVVAFHLFNHLGAEVSGSGITVNDTVVRLYHGWESNHPLWLRLIHCTGNIKNVTGVMVNYMCRTQENEGNYSTVSLLPGRWEIDEEVTDVVVSGSYQNVNFSSGSSGTIYPRTQVPGSLSLMIGTLDGSNDEAGINRNPFVLGAQTGGYYNATYYPQQINYGYSWYDDLIIQMVPNIDNSVNDRTLAWNVNSSAAPPGNPHPGSNEWLPTDAVSSNGNWAYVNLILTDF